VETAGTGLPQMPRSPYSGLPTSRILPAGRFGQSCEKYRAFERLLILAKNKGSETGRKCSFFELQAERRRSCAGASADRQTMMSWAGRVAFLVFCLRQVPLSCAHLAP